MSFMAFSMASPIFAGLLTTTTPASCRAETLPAAVPFPPLTIAPAWPIRRPGGAVPPAMNETTGFPQLFSDVTHNNQERTASCAKTAVPSRTTTANGRYGGSETQWQHRPLGHACGGAFVGSQRRCQSHPLATPQLPLQQLRRSPQSAQCLRPTYVLCLAGHRIVANVQPHPKPVKGE